MLDSIQQSRVQSTQPVASLRKRQGEVKTVSTKLYAVLYTTCNRAKSGPRGLREATEECCSSIGPRTSGGREGVSSESTTVSSDWEQRRLKVEVYLMMRAMTARPKTHFQRVFLPAFLPALSA